MIEAFAQVFIPVTVRLIELTGVAIIAAGALLTLIVFLSDLVRRQPVDEAIACFRSKLGRSILLGLEFLVAADIIQTILIELSLENVAALAVIVLIRTLLSFSLEAEIEGQWPWRRAGERRG